MNILLLMLSKGEGTGGMEKHCQELANGLSARGHRVTCAASIYHQTQLSKDVKAVTLNAERSRFSPILLASVIKIIKEGSFDIVHAQGSKAAAVLQLISPLIRQTKLVATIHSFKSAYPKESAFCRIIAVSKALAADIGHKNTEVVYNGLAQPQVSALSKALPAQLKSPVWLAVGRLVPAKGFDFLIDAFQHAEGTLLIAGSGPEQKSLEQQVESTSQQNKVILLGHRDDVPALMEFADGVVISSRREGFSYAFAEALLAGKPVIATDVPIANEFLDSRFIHRGFTPKLFARMLTANTDELQQAQSDSRKKARESLSLENMIENTVGVYSECLSHYE
ncbi:glycosyltransferase [Marinobacter sp. 1-3A]|uniref:glycosyltransferase n=1 Tax=Marinobacter sp. 1-3A TaxID=2582920 RepID=UPI0019084B0E|nr:glycosyltransferase [Marinobacter sp. 1-3A]MBK1874738.1 glycosyltransferase [Marinobacter sp. 1-3A]